MKRILVVEDDQAILRGLKDALTQEHYDVLTCSDGTDGLNTAKSKKVDAIVLDVMLPGMNGFDVCRALRSEGNQVPVLMLTGKGEESDKVLGLELGADDYLTKPFSIRELLARVKALLRRQTNPAQDIAECTFGDVYLDFKKQEGRRGSKALKMTAKEYDLIKYFLLHEGEVVSRAQLLDDVWGYEATPTTRTVDNFILNLRKKVESNPSKPKHLLTIHTVGYKFVR